MRAELKGFMLWTDPRQALAEFVPADVEYFGLSCSAWIGPVGDDDQTAFDFKVCTPRWLADNFNDRRLTHWTYDSGNLLYGSGLILMERWDFAELEASVKRICEDAIGQDWLTIANHINPWLPWEFQDRVDAQLAELGFPKTPSGDN
jgi:Immunity protein 8